MLVEETAVEPFSITGANRPKGRREDPMSWLEKVTHLLLIMVCCSSLIVLSQRFWPGSSKTEQSRYSKAAPSVAGSLTAVGDALPVPGVDWRASRATLVVAVRPGCKYCEASLPFYGRIAKLKQKQWPDLSIVVLSPDSSETTRAFSSAGIGVNKIIQLPLAAMGVPGTPAIFLVDSRGVVTQRIVGEIRSPGETALISSITAAEGGSYAVSK
jgi:hypothetical protein